MNVLVSNDDGIGAKGLHVLVKALSEVPGNVVYVVAPDGQRSACGHGITMKKPIMVTDYEGNEVVPGAVYAEALSGTPADCVKSGIKRLKREQNIKIDAVFSGINHGGNIGSDVLYSGTVSAAAEGVLCGVPAVAVSVGTHEPTDEMLENCATIVKEICTKALPELPADTLLNVNFPPVPPAELKGLKVAKLGPREYDEQFSVKTNEEGQKYYYYTGDMVVYEGLDEDYDVMCHQDGYVTVTPVMLDLTKYNYMEKVRNWNLQF